MKKLLLFLFIIVKVHNVFSQVDTLFKKKITSPNNFDSIILYYDNMKIKEIYYFKPHYIKSLCYYENGQKKTETFYYSELLVLLYELKKITSKY